MRTAVTVKELLEHCLNKHGAKIVAGAEGLSRTVSKISVAELPDSPIWMRSGDLVCSTGYNLQNNMELQHNWTRGLANNNVAGLIFKPSRFYESVPAEMLKCADELSFPIITVEFEVTWASIIEDVMDYLLSSQVENLKYTYQMHQELLQLVLLSKPVKGIINKISEMAGCPVILEDRFFNPIFYASPEIKEQSDYTARRISKEERENLGNILDEKILRNEIHELPIVSGETTETNCQLISPVIGGKQHFGWVSILLTDKKNYEFAKMILEHGSSVIALSFNSDFTLLHSQEKERAYYLKLLANEVKVDDKEFQRISGLLGINLSTRTVIILIKTPKDIAFHVYSELQNLIKVYDRDAVLFFYDDEITIIYHPANVSKESATNETIKIINELLSRFQKFQNEWHAGISGVCQKECSLKAAYSDATVCLEKSIRENKMIVTSLDLKMEKVISLIPRKSLLNDFIDEMIGKLIQYDADYNSELLQTLHEYILNKYSKSKTASALHVHLNTLDYRLKRIQDILEVDLDDAQICALLFFALQARLLTDKH